MLTVTAIPWKSGILCSRSRTRVVRERGAGTRSASGKHREFLAAVAEHGVPGSSTRPSAAATWVMTGRRPDARGCR